MAPATLPLQRPSPPALSRVVLALLPLLLGGCSGTPFGEALSRSFPGPTATPGATATPSPADAQATRQSGALANPGAPPAGPAATTGVKPGAAAADPVATPAGAGTAATSAALAKPGAASAPGAVPAAGLSTAVTQRPAARAPANPAPYRVTIRLPQADPSAPAEVVTEALRAAGVPFEVETIERMGGVTTPAPVVAPVVPSVPQVRPAPPPR